MLVLLNTDEIIYSVEQRLRKFVNEIRYRESDETILMYVSRDKVADKIGAGYTSARQMNNLAKKISKDYSVEVEVIFTIKDDHKGLEDAFFQMLKLKFPDDIVSFYMSFSDETTANSWLEVADLNSELKSNIEEYFLNILSDAELSSGTIEWIDSDEDLPTLPWLLRFLKTNQPVSLEAMEGLVREDFSLVSKRWLNQKLDQLRRKKLIVRERTGNYCLSAKGLSIVPAGARYTSSDVDRALALGRKKW